jgi:hypothetical protein
MFTTRFPSNIRLIVECYSMYVCVDGMFTGLLPSNEL